MFKILIILLTVLSSFLPFTPLKAIEVSDLYQASVALDSRNNADRAIALKEALGAVMVKVGGNKSVLENKVIKKALIDYRLYLNQYRYHLKVKKIITPKAQETKKNEDLFLLASFNEDKINLLFQQANLAIWGSLRPQILLWLVTENGFVRKIIANSTDSDIPMLVNQFSSQRGLPIMMPLMDLTDANQITQSDVWGSFEQPIRVASTRYFAEDIVVMRISNSSLLSDDSKKTVDNKENNCGSPCTENIKEQRYILDWSLLGWNIEDEKKIITQQYQGNDQNKLIQQGLADITDLIYEHYALSTTSNNEFVIEVNNIDSLAKYVDVFDFLTNLSAVKTVSLLKAEGTSRRFNLQILGSSDAFVASLKLNKQLKEFIDPLSRFNENILNNKVDVVVPIFYWNN
jgi:hypothetical protein